MSTPKLKRVYRLDSIKLDETYWTGEGYLVDHPIVTTCGIFEYALSNGGVRRELRLPENVFDPESLASYKGKPVIITHDAGTVDKNNVEDEIIGTILSEGYQDGEDVRAEIVIHDTDAMRNCGLRELSLGYSLDLDETPGTWKGQKYDAIQKNIRVNHLALVDEARAGDQARLNIDSRDTLTGGKVSMATPKTTKKTPKGGTRKAANNDGVARAIARFKARRAKRLDEAENTPAEGLTPEELVQLVKDRRDRRDAEGDPQDMTGAMGTIAQMDEDMDTLLGVIDTLMAASDFVGDCDPSKTDGDDDPEDPAGVAMDGEGENCDEGEGEDPDNADEGEEENADEGDDPENMDEGEGDDPENMDEGEEDDPEVPASPAVNGDSRSTISEHLSVCRIGDKLNLDGLDRMSLMAAKKAIIKKVRPGIRLDGKGKAYIDAAYDMAVQEVKSRKSTDFQRQQMMGGGKKTRSDSAGKGGSAEAARKRMMERNTNRNGGNK